MLRPLFRKLFPRRIRADVLDVIKLSALETFSAPVFIMRNGEIVFANKACCDAFGAKSTADIVGQSITQRLMDQQPDGLSMPKSMAQFGATFKAQGFVRRLWAFKRLDGSPLIVRSTVAVVPYPDPEWRCSVAVVEDIKSFDAERALREQVVDACGRMTETARVLTDNARELSESSDHATSMLQKAHHSAQETRANAQAIALTSEQLTHSIDAITARMSTREAATLEATQKVLEVRSTLSSLEAAAAKVDAVVELVSRIAQQTHLLAINAAIQAAHAGSAGWGFSVVATEVKMLAAETMRANNDIRQQIRQVQEVAKVTVHAMDSVTRNVEKLQHDTLELGAEVRQQRDATHGIAGNVKDVTMATSALTDTVRGLSDVVAANDDLADRVLNRSSGLNAEAEALHTTVRTQLAG